MTNTSKARFTYRVTGTGYEFENKSEWLDNWLIPAAMSGALRNDEISTTVITGIEFSVNGEIVSSVGAQYYT